MKSPLPQKNTTHYWLARIISGLGALGVALQNYLAVELFLKGIFYGSKWFTTLIKPLSIAAGGVGSGMVNLWMNIPLLEGFFARMDSNEDYFYKTLSTWEKVQYFGGIFVFVVTGILFGLMAFTFAMEGPLAILAVASGVFVSVIMTIQEVETWLKSYNFHETEEKPLSDFQKLGKICGHIIALGNVLALSLLFTLSLAESLILLQIAALPAFIMAFSVAFTFGAFTEYYFYNFYCAEFCKDFYKNCQLMSTTDHPFLGGLCVLTNACVNAALTYSGVGLLSGLFVTAGLGVPSVVFVTGLSVVSAFFAGSASFILGMDFWIGDKPQNAPDNALVKETLAEMNQKPSPSPANDEALIYTPGLSFFPSHAPVAKEPLVAMQAQYAY